MLTQKKITTIQRAVDTEREEKLARTFSALADPGRLCIFEVLLQKERLCVTDASRILGVSLPAASQQLKILANADLIRREREGKMVCYEANWDNPSVAKLQNVLHT